MAGSMPDNSYVINSITLKAPCGVSPSLISACAAWSASVVYARLSSSPCPRCRAGQRKRCGAIGISGSFVHI